MRTTDVSVERSACVTVWLRCIDSCEHFLYTGYKFKNHSNTIVIVTTDGLCFSFSLSTIYQKSITWRRHSAPGWLKTVLYHCRCLPSDLTRALHPTVIQHRSPPHLSATETRWKLMSQSSSHSQARGFWRWCLECFLMKCGVLTSEDACVFFCPLKTTQLFEQRLRLLLLVSHFA